MTELYEKSLSKLELSAVLEQLADCAHSENAKEKCRKLLPLDDAEEITLLQGQTSAACKLISLKGSVFPWIKGNRTLTGARRSRRLPDACRAASDCGRFEMHPQCEGIL